MQELRNATSQDMAQANVGGRGALAYVFGRDVLKRSLAIAAVVGCLLSVANQLDVMLREPVNRTLVVKIFERRTAGGTRRQLFRGATPAHLPAVS